MSGAPGKLVFSQVATMPDGNPAEVVLDVEGNVYARWRIVPDLRSRPFWSEWRQVSTGAVAVSLAPAGRNERAGYVTVTSGAPAGGRTVYLLTADGVGATAL